MCALSLFAAPMLSLNPRSYLLSFVSVSGLGIHGKYPEKVSVKDEELIVDLHFRGFSLRSPGSMALGISWQTVIRLGACDWKGTHLKGVRKQRGRQERGGRGEEKKGERW